MQKLKKVYIEITNVCNLSCSFCAGTTRSKRFMSLAEFDHVLWAVKPHTDYIYLHVLGEPLLHPELGPMLDLCEENGIKASITTNATLIKSQKENLAHKPALRQINYSLHSLFEHGGDAGEQSGDSVNTILRDIYDLISATGDRVYHCLRLWNFESEDEYKNERIKSVLAALFGGIALPAGITAGSGVKIAQNVFLQQQQRFVWPNIGGEEIFLRGKCGGLKHDAGILVDGSVVPCCLDGNGDLILGNIFNEPLETILNMPKAGNIRDGFTKNEVREKFCKTCGFAKRNFG
jgi:radical SAM protein with 4Fe4S-binding SPASM domain